MKMREVNTLKELRESIQRKQRKYDELRAECQVKLDLIKQGHPFGFPDIFDIYSYHPLKLIEIVDENDFMIKIREESIKYEAIISISSVIVNKEKEFDWDYYEDLFEDYNVQSYFEYLDDLKKSNEVNMFGASRYLIDEFILEKNKARDILSAWMKTCSERGIE